MQKEEKKVEILEKLRNISVKRSEKPILLTHYFKSRFTIFINKQLLV